MFYDNDSVRRQDRLLDEPRARELLRSGEYGVLSMADAEEGAYGIPVNYVWNGDSTLYIHCAPEGRKLRLIDADDSVSFCVVGRVALMPAQFSTAYESVVLSGHIRRGLPPEERMHALMLILDKYSPEFKETGIKYTEKSFPRTEILRMDIERMSGKSKRMPRL